MMHIEKITWREIPLDIRTISVATGIRWIGWGMAEPVMPLFLFSVFHDYGRSASVEAAGQFLFVAILPIAGILADRISLKRLLVVSLIFFCFDGLWSLAAATGLAALALVASLFDGVAVTSDVVGRATYIRRYASPSRIATTMGIQGAIINAGFIVGALVSILAIRFVSIGWILFGIIPTNLVALYLVSTMEEDHIQASTDGAPVATRIFSYRHAWRGTLQCSNEFPTLGALILFLNCLVGLTTVLIPIYAYAHGLGPQWVILMGILAVLPELFAAFLGRIADHYRQQRLLVGGLGVVGVSLALFGYIGPSNLLFVHVLVLRTVIVLLDLVVEGVVTKSADAGRYGSLSAAMEGLKNIGKLIGTVGLAFSMDRLGVLPVFYGLACLAFVLAGFIYLKRTRGIAGLECIDPAVA